MPAPAPPREVVPGVFWTGGCLEAAYDDRVIHQNVSTYLVVGSDATLLVDTGHPKDWALVQAHLEAVLGDRPLDYVFPTHAELPHAGNIARLVERWPQTRVVGDVRDYHLFWPEVTPRLEAFGVGDVIDLGARTFTFVDGLMRDLPMTLWGFDDATATLFVSDAYAYTHDHEAGQCFMVAEELPDLPSPEQTRYINEKALYFLRYVELDPLYAALSQLREELGVRVIAPAHGCVITDPPTVIPALEEGYGQVSLTKPKGS